VALASFMMFCVSVLLDEIELCYAMKVSYDMLDLVALASFVMFCGCQCIEEYVG
jgi:hypothetical protein